MCKCIGNKECEICYAAFCAAWDKEYVRYKAAGMEDFLEAKEFMWDFVAQRDRENIENEIDAAIDDSDESQWTY